MALGMPALVSPVGMNSEVVHDGVNGFVCATEADWYAALRRLLADQPERARQGEAARRTIVERYSVAANTANFLSLFAPGRAVAVAGRRQPGRQQRVFSRRPRRSRARNEREPALAR